MVRGTARWVAAHFTVVALCAGGDLVVVQRKDIPRVPSARSGACAQVPRARWQGRLVLRTRWTRDPGKRADWHSMGCLVCLSHRRAVLGLSGARLRHAHTRAARNRLGRQRDRPRGRGTVPWQAIREIVIDRCTLSLMLRAPALERLSSQTQRPVWLTAGHLDMFGDGGSGHIQCATPTSHRDAGADRSAHRLADNRARSALSVRDRRLERRADAAADRQGPPPQPARAAALRASRPLGNIGTKVP